MSALIKKKRDEVVARVVLTETVPDKDYASFKASHKALLNKSNAKVESLALKHREASSLLSKAESRIEKLSGLISDRDAKVEGLLALNAKLSAELEDALSACVGLEEQRDLSIGELKSLDSSSQRGLSELSSKVSSLELENDGLKDELNGSRVSHEVELSELKEELSDKCLELAASEDLLASVKDAHALEFSKLASDLALKDSDVLAAKRELSNSLSLVESLEKTIGKLNSKLTSFSDLQASNRNLSKQYKVMSSAIEAKDDEIHQYELLVSRLVKELDKNKIAVSFSNKLKTVVTESYKQYVSDQR